MKLEHRAALSAALRVGGGMVSLWVGAVLYVLAVNAGNWLLASAIFVLGLFIWFVPLVYRAQLRELREAAKKEVA